MTISDLIDGFNKLSCNYHFVNSTTKDWTFCIKRSISKLD